MTRASARIQTPNPRAFSRRFAGLAVLLFGLVVAPAQAQTPPRADLDGAALALAEAPPAAVPAAKKSPASRALLDAQLAASLASPVEQVRQQAMQNIIFLATYRGDEVRFEQVVAPLLNVYLFGGNEGHRILAVTALHAIGDRYGMRRLRETVRDVNADRVRLHTLRALNDFYGEK